MIDIEKFLQEIGLSEHDINKLNKYFTKEYPDENKRCDAVFSFISKCTRRTAIQVSKEYIKNIKNQKLGFDSDEYSEYRELQAEQDEFITNPFVMSNNDEGFEACAKCKSTKTYLMSIQTRSSDEGTSCMVICANCNFRQLRAG